MCYGVQARKEMALQVAKSRGDKGAVERLKLLLVDKPELDHHFANAFDHPQLVVYTDALPHEPQLFTWGLVPTWVKDDAQRKKLWNQTLNARGESIFEKPAFRSAAKARRALVYVEGFYEHYHFGGRAYPFFIGLQGRNHFALAALWEQWKAPETGAVLHTFSIVTCAPNELMRGIHNNPKIEGPRMPLILAPGEEEQWLLSVHTEADEAVVQALVRPYPAEAMVAHSIRPLLGKEGVGNALGAAEPYEYPELALGGPFA